MKLRNFLIVLLVLLMAFAFASCKNEPEKPQEEPLEPAKTYRLTATLNRSDSWYSYDKFTFMLYNVPGFKVKEGDVLSFSFRSNRDIPEFSLRQKSNPEGYVCWIYEDSSAAFTTFEVGEDGWTTATYKFGPTVFIKDNDIPREEWETMKVNYGKDGLSDVRLDFRGVFFAGDVLDVKDLCLNGKPIAVTEAVVSDFVMPTLEVDPTTDLPAKTPSVGYVVGSTSSSNVPTFEQVALGATINPTLSKDGYTYELYTNAKVQDETTLFDLTTPITNDIILYIKWVPIFYDVAFNLDGATSDAIETQSIQHGQTATRPADDPQKTGQVFGGWYADADKTIPFDFADPVTEAKTVYAAWGDPVAVTFNAENETASTVVNAAKNYPVVPIADPVFGSKIFEGWYLEGATKAFDFSTPITEPIELHAHWVNATDVTLKEGDTITKTFKAALDEALDPKDKNLEVEKRIASFFEGWYTDPDCKNAYSFETVVTEPLTLYAKWRPGNIAQIVSTYNRADNKDNCDKFRVKFQSGDYKTVVKGGDVLTFKYRSTTPITKFNVRGDKKWIYQQDFKTPYVTAYDVGADGWISVTYTFPGADGTNAFDDGQGTIPVDFYNTDRTFYFDFISYTIVKGDIVEVQGMALNGVELTIDSGNVTSGDSSIKPTVNAVEKDYSWIKQTVTFNTGVADTIDSIDVEFGGRAARPAEDPAKAGYHFSGWFADAEFTKEFDFANTVITKATTIYAKIGVAKIVTFNSNEGSSVSAIEVAEGDKVAQPSDPTKDGVVFAGWFSDEGLTTAYNFNTPVTADITLYAKWVSPKKLSLNLNYENAPVATVLDVEGGVALTSPKNPARVGYFFGGWYKEEGCTNEFSFADGITEDTIIYAKWNAPTEYYKFTAKSDAADKDRFQWVWSANDVGVTEFKKGDTLTIMVRSTPSTGNALAEFRLRNGAEEEIGYKYVAFPEKDGDGWHSITVTFDEDKAGSGLVLGLYVSGHTKNVKAGDICEIKAAAFNGVALPVGDMSYAIDATRDVIQIAP